MFTLKKKRKKKGKRTKKKCSEKDACFKAVIIIATQEFGGGGWFTKRRVLCHPVYARNAPTMRSANLLCHSNNNSNAQDLPAFKWCLIL